MGDNLFAAAFRRAATISRRGSCQLLIGAGAAGVIAAPSAAVGKTRNNAQRCCRKQASECRTGVERSCLGDTGCLGSHLPCCEHFAQCRADIGMLCLSTGQPLPVARL